MSGRTMGYNISKALTLRRRVLFNTGTPFLIHAGAEEAERFLTLPSEERRCNSASGDLYQSAECRVQSANLELKNGKG